MNQDSMMRLVRDLHKDLHVTVYKDDGIEISLFRPSALPPRMDPEKYDVNKNFQIWLHLPDGRKFKPNHLRIFVDLGLRSRCRPDLKR